LEIKISLMNFAIAPLTWGCLFWSPAGCIFEYAVHSQQDIRNYCLKRCE
jgi:hypothetical protein